MMPSLQQDTNVAKETTVGAVAVVGGGVSGIQAALDLADSGFTVYLVESSGAIGGAMAQLDKTFPTNDCSMCILAPKLVECGRHPNIRLLTLCQVTAIAGVAGDFTLTVKQAPRYVDMSKCVACDLCSQRCPKNVDIVQGAVVELRRKAIYLKYPQAVPLKYQIDPKQCLNFKRPGSCGLCQEVCPPGAIDFTQEEKTLQLSVGAVILSPGFESYDPTDAGVWNYGNSPNILTSRQLERYFSVVGPTEGKLKRPSDSRAVSKIAFLQCVGSREDKIPQSMHCSSVCCMHSIKQAVLARSISPILQASIFYVDMRTHGKGFDAYLEHAREEVGVRFVRCRVGSVETEGDSGDLRLRYVNEEGRQIEELYDMVVLASGLQSGKSARELAHTAGIRENGDGFVATSNFTPVLSSREGIFTCGTIAGPKDIPQSVLEGSAAAAATAELLTEARGVPPSLTEEVTAETDGEPRIGVFVCHCGSNIASHLHIEEVAKYATTLPEVVFVERALFTCSQDSQELITRRIKEHRLNRIVIAACSPRTHEPLFRQTLKAAGLNQYLVEMANIRNQNTWVHSNDPEAATAKAKDLIRMAVAKVTYSTPLLTTTVPIVEAALVVGGGVSGMTSALSLAEQGFTVHLVEKSTSLGGNALNLKHTWTGEHVPTQVNRLINRISSHPKIELHLQSQVTGVDGFLGNFVTTIKSIDGGNRQISHGAGIIATGGEAASPDEYGFGQITRVVTSVQFDRLFELKEKHVKQAKRFVFIQCVGSREPDNMYCSKVCCSHSVQSAIALKKENPEREVYVLYRDMRTYGEREVIYRQARKLGVVFINYELHGKPRVTASGEQVEVEVWDHLLHRPMVISADMVVLAVAIRPREEAANLAKLYKVPLDENGFFQEAHPKLRPVDFITDGMYVAGLAHYPKPMEEAIAQAMAAAGRAATLLTRQEVVLDATRAVVDKAACDGCAICVGVCPFHALTMEGKEGEQLVVVNLAQCKGCGLCQGTCPKRGIYVSGFSQEQLIAQVRAALAA